MSWSRILLSGFVRKFCAFKAVSALFPFLLFSHAAFASVEWTTVKSDHFEVVYKNAPGPFIQTVIASAEKYYLETTETLGLTRYKSWAWDQRVRIYIYDDAGEYQAVTRIGWSSGEMSVKLRTMRTYPAAQGFFDSTLPHELAHVVLRDFVGFGDNVPLWLDEGFAMYQEKARRFGANAAVRDLLKRGKFIPIKDLMTMDLRSSSREEIDIFYDEAASLVAFLIDKMEVYRFVRLCKDLKEGRRFDWALPRAYMKFQNISQLEGSWKEYLANEKNR